MLALWPSYLSFKGGCKNAALDKYGTPDTGLIDRCHETLKRLLILCGLCKLPRISDVCSLFRQTMFRASDEPVSTVIREGRANHLSGNEASLARSKCMS